MLLLLSVQRTRGPRGVQHCFVDQKRTWLCSSITFFCPACNLEPRRKRQFRVQPLPSAGDGLQITSLPYYTPTHTHPVLADMFPFRRFRPVNLIPLQGALHIPRPVLTVVHARQEDSSPPPPTLSGIGNDVYDLSGRCDTPTHFTLLGQSGVILRHGRSTPTTCQLSMTFCTLALLALVGMIVYMEGTSLSIEANNSSATRE